MPRRALASASLAVAPAVAALAAVAPAAAAPAADPVSRTVNVVSFDGTRLVTHFFPAAHLTAGHRAPTIMLGHGWGGRGETDPAGGQLGPLLAAGYNVVTWNARGFGSGGAANVDYYKVEGRDSTALIDWIAGQPEVQLDGRGDPRLGMAGGSYGGGVQLLTAGLDRRVDVIAPTIAWNSLSGSLVPDQVFKAGWGLYLCLGGVTSGNMIATPVAETCVTGLASGTASKANLAWFADHDLTPQIKKIRIPTLIVQGTVDTLFPLRQGLLNYAILKKSGVPLKMVWYCGGHGVCSTTAGPDGHVGRAELDWFNRYLKKDASVRTGYGFEYVDQTGTLRGGAGYPLPAQAPIRATGGGRLVLTDAEATGTQMAAQPAKTAITVPIAPVAGESVGVPHLTMTYKGVGTRTSSPVFAQLVDRTSGLVLGNQATPIPLTLDGRTHSVDRDLEAIAYQFTAQSDVVLQIIPDTRLYDPQRAIGWVDASKITVTLPRVSPGTVLTS